MQLSNEAAIGYMILAARAEHLSADIEEMLDYAMREAMATFTVDDAVRTFREANKEGDVA